jgi:hypothetical protein
MNPRAGEKRRTPRIQPYVVPCRLTLADGRQVGGHVTDLSSQGAQVAADGDPPEAGSQLLIEIRLRRSALWPRAHAEVKWLRPADQAGAPFTCGLTFVDLAPEAQALIEAALDEFRKRAALLSARPA